MGKKNGAKTQNQERIIAASMTLAQQMKISPGEIKHRLKLLSFTADDVRSLKGCYSTVVLCLDQIVDAFYDVLKHESEIMSLIGDQETFQRLHASMKNYISELFAGSYDTDYANKRLRIGLVHKRIGVSPKLFISAVNLLESTLECYICAPSIAEWQSSLCDDRRRALRKLFMFDVQLVFDTYIRGLLTEVEAAKAEIERYANSLERIVEERTQELKALSRMDSLTNLGNQRSFYEDIRRELARAERFHEPLVLAYFDLNCFKTINDTKGHLAGDNILSVVGRCFKDVARETDFCYRYGGDEFCVILSNATIATGTKFVERLFARFDTETTEGITFSAGLIQVGVETYPAIDQFVRAADGNMYAAKALSRTTPGHQTVSSVYNQDT